MKGTSMVATASGTSTACMRTAHRAGRYGSRPAAAGLVFAVAAIIGVVPGCAWPNDSGAHRAGITTQGPPWFGVLETSGDHIDEEVSAGITVATLSLSWEKVEPSPGVFDQEYAQRQQRKLASFRAAGMKTVLDLGLQYPPGWVFSLDRSTRFANQYGDVWHGNLSEDVPNAVFDHAVRLAQDEYIRHVRAQFDSAFWAIRVGGLLSGELRYPPPTYNGHTNCYWAYDPAARSLSPVPNWTPGAPSREAAQRFFEFYAGSLTEYQNWLIRTVRQYFSGWIEVLYPSWGIRPGQAKAAIDGFLSGQTPAEQNQTISMGLDWISQVTSIPDPHVIVYTTWIDAPDQGPTLQLRSPIHYLESLASRRLPVGGENSGSNSADDLRRVIKLAHTDHLTTAMWLSEPDLIANRYGTSLQDFASALKASR